MDHWVVILLFCSSRIVHPYRRNQPWFQVYTSVCPTRKETFKNTPHTPILPIHTQQKQQQPQILRLGGGADIHLNDNLVVSEKILTTIILNHVIDLNGTDVIGKDLNKHTLLIRWSTLIYNPPRWLLLKLINIYVRANALKL